MGIRTTQTRPTSAVLRLGAQRSLTISVGTVVLVRDQHEDCYGAVVSSIDGTYARLTFTPEGKPRRVPMGTILSTVSAKAEPLDPKALPRIQPPPNTVPRRLPHTAFPGPPPPD